MACTRCEMAAQARSLLPHAQVVLAPTPYDGQGKSVFLAGSLSKVNGEYWQNTTADALSTFPITILNPYRPDWDASWREDISFGPFREQTEWELDMQEAADIIALYFGPEAKAPVSLLELGIAARSGKAVVACPEGYWKKGNVQIVCARYNIPVFGKLEDLIDCVKERLRGVCIEEKR